MVGKEIYKIYAPKDAKWTDWIRPVPFVAIDIYKRQPLGDFQDINIMFIQEYRKDIIIFVDLPGKESVEFGVGLARIGYRPIPVFNGTDEQLGALATTNTDLIESSLINGGEKLKNIQLSSDANPAFLLDSYRTNTYRASETIYDNSWDIYKQDLPTAEYFIQNGIDKIIVIGEKVQRDLKKILLKAQEKGIKIYLTDGYILPKRVILSKTIRERFEKEEL